VLRLVGCGGGTGDEAAAAPAMGRGREFCGGFGLVG
jgi:hypothetical protein